MKKLIAILLCLFVHASNGQQADTTLDFSGRESINPSNTYNLALREKDAGVSFQRSTQKQLHSRPNVLFITPSFVLSPIENEILDQEATECNAMINRDQEKLKVIWLRDFSLDELPHELMSNESGLPFYASLSRMIENFSSFGELAFTSGFEQVRKLNPNGNLEKEFKRKFFHTWAFKNGVWKLSIKTYSVAH